MTKTKKTILITLLSSMLIFCAALCAILSTPLSSVYAATTSPQDVCDNATFDLIKFNVDSPKEENGTYYGSYSAVWFIPSDYYSSAFSYGAIIVAKEEYDEIGPLSDYNLYPNAILFNMTNPHFEEARNGYTIGINDHVYTNDGSYPFLRDEDSEMIYVFFCSVDANSEKYYRSPVVVSLSNGYYTLNETTTPDDDPDDTEIDSSGYNAIFLKEGLDFYDCYFAVPENLSTVTLVMFTGTNNFALEIHSPTVVKFGGEPLESVGVTMRDGVKAYLYDFSDMNILWNKDGTPFVVIPNRFVVSKMGVAADECYLLSSKTTTPEPDPGSGEPAPEKDYTNALINRTGKELKRGVSLYGTYLFVSGNSTVLTVQFKNSNGDNENGTLEFSNSAAGWTWVFKDNSGNEYTKNVVFDDDGYATYNGVEGYVFDFTEEVDVFCPLGAGRYIVHSIDDTVKVNSIETDGDVYLFETSNSFRDSNNTFNFILTIAGTVVGVVILVLVVKKLFNLLSKSR